MKIKDCVASAAVGFFAPAAVATAGTLFILALASLISEDQRAYNSCLLKHKSADYCRLIVSGR